MMSKIMSIDCRQIFVPTWNADSKPGRNTRIRQCVQRGFTLIELLVVISIIALLLSIMMPSLRRAKKQANLVVCQSNLRQWGQFFLMYANDSNGCFMPGWTDTLSTKKGDIWIDALWSYYGDTGNICICPEAKTFDSSRELFSTTWDIRGHYGIRNYISGSYGHNGWVANPRPNSQMPVTVAGGTPDAFVRKSGEKMSYRIPLFMDSLWFSGYPSHTDEPPEFNGAPFWDSGGTINNMKRFCFDRHNGYVGAVFLDMSVSKVGLKELWTLKWHRNFNTGGPWTEAGGVSSENWPEWMIRYTSY